MAADEPSRREWLALAAILVLAAALRLCQIDALPPGLWYDEAANGVDALRVLQGEHPIFFEGNNGREPLYIYLVALSFRLFGAGPTSIRLVSVALGWLTVLATYLLARELLGRRVALLAAFVAATAFWPVSLSRLGLRAVALPLFEALAAYFLWRAVRRGQTWCYAAAGLAGGLSLYTYLASRATPLWLGPFALLLLLPGWRSGAPLGRRARGVAILALVAALTFAPLGSYFLGHPRQFLGRVESVGVSGQTGATQAPSDDLLDSTLKTLGLFGWQGDLNPRHNLPGRPVFDVFLAAAFLLGLGVAIRRLRRPEYALLLLWTAVMLLPGALSTEAPHFLRTSGILPAALIFPAIGVDAAWRLAATVPSRAVRSSVAVGLALGLGVGAALSARDYFVSWAGRTDVYYAFLGDVLDATRLGVQYADRGAVVVAAWTYRGDALPVALYPETSRLARTLPGTEDLVIPQASGGDLYYVYPRTATPDGGLPLALRPYAEPVATLRDRDGNVAVSAYRVPSGAMPQLRPSRDLVARFGDVVGLLGYDLDRRVEPGQSVRLTLYAKPLRPAQSSDNWQFFAHLISPVTGASVASAYAVACHSTWQAGDQLVVWLDLKAPPSLAPGLYRIQLGIFDSRDMRRQRIFDGAGRDVGDVLVLGPVLAPDPAAPTVQRPDRLGVSLGDRIRLLDYTLASAPRAGEPLRLTLYWRADQPVLDDYTVFVHLVDSAGKLVGQQDIQPGGGQRPTGVWAPGEVVADEHQVPVAAGLHGQRLKLLVGLYRPETGERLPVRGGGGSDQTDYVTLGEVTPQ